MSHLSFTRDVLTGAIGFGIGFGENRICGKNVSLGPDGVDELTGGLWVTSCEKMNGQAR